jgi:hypothetical protein
MLITPGPARRPQNIQPALVIMRGARLARRVPPGRSIHMSLITGAARRTPLGWLPTLLHKPMAPPGRPLVEGARIFKQDTNTRIAVGAGHSVAQEPKDLIGEAVQ